MTHKRWKVLVVDDEPNNLQLLGQILQDHYKLAFATDGLKALDVAGKVTPDLILLDIMMPGMNGYQVCRRLKSQAETRKIPVIFVTAKGEIVDESKGFEVGCVDYITKPVSSPLVRARVKTHLALYDQNRVLEEKVMQRTVQLQEALSKVKSASLDSIHRLSKAAEYKDEDTGAHILRISHYSAAVARQMGLDEPTVELILYAAPMHDVGKIGTPDRVLLKPGKLDAEEWETMKQHAVNGARILEGSDADLIKMAKVIALSHHEKCDGNGYPQGLSGEQIPLAGRIVAIADVFDALTSKRPYKAPFSLEKSCAIIKEGRGSHFDPDVVDAFFAVEEEILSIKGRYQEEEVNV